MRVVAGEKRGRKLFTLEGDSVRPTTDRVKESIFSIIQFYVEGSVFLDLFAGSGQMAIEALSRGAARAVLVDSSRKSCEICRQNLKLTEYQDKSVLVNAISKNYLTDTRERFDIAFLDPPYHLDMLEENLLLVTRRMTDDAVIVCEHPLNVVLPQKVENFNLKKTYKYGNIMLTVYVNKAQED